MTLFFNHAAQIIGPNGQPVRDSGIARTGNGWVTQATDAAREASVRFARRVLRYSNERPGIPNTLVKRAIWAKRASGHLLQHEPWLVGVAGMLTGTALAVMLPPTRIEQDYPLRSSIGVTDSSSRA